MNSKQFLEQAIVLRKSIQEIEDSIKFYDMLGRGSGAIRYDRDGSQTQRSFNAPFELPMCEKRDLEQEDEKKRAELWRKLAEIHRVVNQVEDQNVQNILRAKFITQKSEEKIANEHKISKSTVRRRLEDGYHEVSLITGYPEPPKQRMPGRERTKKLFREVYVEND